ncbi:hypothetical protein MKW98_022702 [Papaver atlanticum]|uniref:BRX domain-containing protein n=1 Tax=Papaver atlanticum TaxID=357466 RepID=A0AAD4T405_9MAGN|nr:hypothetical protein MKW98_022702 [Papaver atlanticum]
MLTCIACSKQQLPGGGTGSTTLHEQEDDDTTETPRTKQAVKTLSAQRLGFSILDQGHCVEGVGAYKNCKPFSGLSNQHVNYADSDNGSASERLHRTYHRPGSGSSSSTPRQWGKEMEARLKGLSSGEGTPPSRSGKTESIVLMDEEDSKELVAQVELGVLITFVSMPEGGNDLKRIRFSRGMHVLYIKFTFRTWQTRNFTIRIRSLCKQSSSKSKTKNPTKLHHVNKMEGDITVNINVFKFNTIRIRKFVRPTHIFIHIQASTWGTYI